MLIVTRSAKRAQNIWTLALHFFRETFNEDQHLDFVEVLTVEQATSKLREVLATAEARERPAEKPWVAELRASSAWTGREEPLELRGRCPARGLVEKPGAGEVEVAPPIAWPFGTNLTRPTLDAKLEELELLVRKLRA